MTLEIWFYLDLYNFLFLTDVFNDFLCFFFCYILLYSLIYLILHLFLLLFHLQSLHFLLLVLTIHFFSKRAFFILICLVFLIDKQLLLARKYLLHLFLKVKIFIAFDWFVIFHTFRVKLDETAYDLAWRRIRQFKLDLVIE